MMVKSILQLVLQNREEMENRQMSWSDFIQRLKTPTVTQETVEDYKNAEIETRRGQRRWGVYWRLVKRRTTERGNTQQRSLVTLDADSTTLDFGTMYSCYLTMPQLLHDTQPFSERSALSLDYSVKSPSDRRRI